MSSLYIFIYMYVIIYKNMSIVYEPNIIWMLMAYTFSMSQELYFKIFAYN